MWRPSGFRFVSELEEWVDAIFHTVVITLSIIGTCKNAPEGMHWNFWNDFEILVMGTRFRCFVETDGSERWTTTSFHGGIP